MYWQSNGDYLLVKVERAKTKKTTVCNYELFRIREKDIPVDVVEIEPSESVTSVYFEPKGERFAALTSEGQKVFLYFYEIQASGTQSKEGAVKVIKKLEKKGINSVVWSPKGRFAIVAGIRAFQGDLEFWDVDELQVMATGEHYMCTDLEWDPTGRYAISSVSGWRASSDVGYTIWTFNGQQLHRIPVPGFKQLLWRPRPPTLLSKEMQTKIKKNLREYSKEFEEADNALSSAASREVVERRKGLWREWMKWRKECEREYERTKMDRYDLRGWDSDEEEGQEGVTTEEWIEEVIEETEEVVQ